MMADVEIEKQIYRDANRMLLALSFHFPSFEKGYFHRFNA